MYIKIPIPAIQGFLDDLRETNLAAATSYIKSQNTLKCKTKNFTSNTGIRYTK